MNRRPTFKITLAMIGILDMVVVATCLVGPCLESMDEHFIRFILGMSKQGKGDFLEFCPKVAALVIMFGSGLQLAIGAYCWDNIKSCKAWIFASYASALLFLLGSCAPAILAVGAMGLTPIVTVAIIFLASYKVLCYHIIHFYVQVEDFKDEGRA